MVVCVGFLEKCGVVMYVYMVELSGCEYFM